MNQMYTTGEEYFQYIFEMDMRPRQNNLDEQEDLFLFTYAKMLLHKRLRIERILSLYANPFYPITEISQIKMETETEKARNIKNIGKEELAKNLRVNIEDIKLKDERAPKKEEWIEVKHRVKNVLTSYDSKEILITNYYDGI